LPKELRHSYLSSPRFPPSPTASTAMTNDAFRQQTYAYFLMEAQDLLQAIEQDLLTLRADRQPARVHNLMRSAHTLKGAAASVGFQSIKTMAHNLEDVFKTLYNPEVVIDAELETLLMISHDCLRAPISAAVAETECHEAEILSRANAAFGQLKAKLGKHFDPNAGIPTSAELGFDITRSIFETGVSERLEELATALANGDPATVTQTLQTHAEVFIGLAESLNLPGFEAIAKTVQTALQIHPEQSLAIAEVALIDYRQGQAAVLTGDRRQGGKPSAALKQFTQKVKPAPQQPVPPPPPLRPAAAPQQPAARESVSPSSVNSTAAAGGTAAVTPLPAPLPTLGPTRLVTESGNRLSKIWHWLMDFLNQPLFSTNLQTPVNPQPLMDLPTVEAPPSQRDRWPSTEVMADSISNNRDRQTTIANDAGLTTADFSPKTVFDPGIQVSIEDFDSTNLSGFESIVTDEDGFVTFDDLDPSTDALADIERFSVEMGKLADDLAGFEAFVDLADLTDPPIAAAPVEELTPALGTVNQASDQQADLWQDPAPAAPVVHSPQQSQPAEGRAEGRTTNGATAKLRVDLAHLEALNYSISELLINQNRQNLQAEQVQGFVKELTDHLRQHQQTMMYLREWSDRLLFTEVKPLRSQAGQAVEFDALELDQHSEMHGLLQDALEEIVRLNLTTEGLDLTVRQSSQTLNRQGRLLMNARDDLMEVRMVPIGAVLNRLPRLLQQLVETYGKQVELQLKGTQVLVDKVIADKLYDPLLHLVRNAFDHGIESAERRMQQGKPAIGTITIHAYQQGNRTLIDIRDDGYGLDFPKICRRAYEAGLLPSDQVDQFTKLELINVLFESGFSTAAEVSDLSGRGVGLDVVRAQLQALKGTVTVQSEPTQGTTFSLQLPLTLMTARLLVCQVGTSVYGFLSDEVERVILPQPQQLKATTGQPIFHWQRGEIEYPVPVHQLSSLITYGLNLPTVDQTDLEQPLLTSDTQPLLLLRASSDGLVGIRIDQVVGEQELVIRPISTAITPPAYIYGCSILADGHLMLVVDGAALVKQSQPQEQQIPPRVAQAKGAVPTEQRSTVKQILVIDDSITIRQTLAETLRNTGYEVIQAQDGLDALAQLQQHPAVQLITCDVEMPRLNGFEFLMRYRPDASLPQVPVVMLTSRTSEKHRQLALQLGATAYMTKPYINQDFVDAIAHLIPVAPTR
jgi:two-component system, chemotaxis family, sensor histidine kinase and response regulator PixL